MTDAADIRQIRPFGPVSKTRFFIFFYLSGSPGELSPGLYRMKANYLPSHKTIIELIRTVAPDGVECVELTGWQELSGSDFQSFSS